MSCPFHRLAQAGEFKALVDHGMEGCKLAGSGEGVIGAEDIHFGMDGLAYISSDDRHWWETSLTSNFSARARNARSQGAIFTFDVTSASFKKLEPLDVENFPQDFHPHGISLLPRVGHTRDASGMPEGAEARLVVVSHTVDGDTVEVLDVVGGGCKLKHVATVRSSIWRNINGVAAIKEGFYVTNYMFHPVFTVCLSPLCYTVSSFLTHICI